MNQPRPSKNTRIVIYDVRMHLPFNLDSKILIPLISACLSLIGDCKFRRMLKRFLSRKHSLAWYNTFARALEQWFETNNYRVKRKCLLWWFITPGRVRREKADLICIPHKFLHDFPDSEKQFLFYNQLIFPWLFTVDPLGWNAGLSVYPIDYSSGDSSSSSFNRYQKKALGNVTKYSQPTSRTSDDLTDDGLIPDGDYLLFPTQVPDDKNLRYFSPYEHDIAVESVARWAASTGKTLIIKLHPYDSSGYDRLNHLSRSENISLLSHDMVSVHDLIRDCRSVITINSGVGLEAFLWKKPVIVLGKAAYDSAAISVDDLSFDSLERAWQSVIDWDPQVLSERYARLYDYLCTQLAIDLDNPALCAHAFDSVMQRVLLKNTPPAEDYLATPGR